MSSGGHDFQMWACILRAVISFSGGIWWECFSDMGSEWSCFSGVVMFVRGGRVVVFHHVVSDVYAFQE